MQRALGGRRMRDDTLHMTLAFLGETDVENLPHLLAPPADLAPPAFTLALDDWGCWKGGIGWAAPSRTPEPLRGLASDLRGWLRDADFRLEARAFAPHVTLVRDARLAALPGTMPPIGWRVDSYVLVRSRPAAGGSRYDVLGRWPLAGPAG